MQEEANPVPVVLCIGGQDPTGGAGIQADAESVAAHGCHATVLPTCVTVQTTHDVLALQALDPPFLHRQATALLDDIVPAAIKIGLIGASDVLATVVGILDALPRVPLVVDPVLAAGGGTALADPELIAGLRANLLPRATLITPNRAEARRLIGIDDADTAAAALADLGPAVLLTGADEADTKLVVNRLYRAGTTPQAFSWPKVDGRFHGSGCTLAAACAARLARGEALADACRRAQSYTWQALAAAHCPGTGQAIPGRLART